MGKATLKRRFLQFFLKQIFSSVSFIWLGIACNSLVKKDYKFVTKGLKELYQATTEENTLMNLETFEKEWASQYLKIAESWRNNWDNIRSIFSYPEEIRRAVNTTNAIESLNSVIRHATKKRKIFSSDESAKKVIYLTVKSASQKWAMLIKNWQSAMNWFMIHCYNQVTDYL